jgi:hypothetical protein
VAERAPGPLAGLRVVELADETAEYVGLVLAGLGADVVKVEPPGGSPSRRIGPFFEDVEGPERSLFFWQYNRSKRSIVLDLDDPADGRRAVELIARADVVVDGSDNFATKFLANDAALAAGKVLVHGGILRFTAQLLTVLPGQTGCLRCLFEAPPPEGAVPSCADAGVLGPLAGFAGALMGGEAARVLAGERGSYAGRLVVYEARSAHARTVPVRLREGCAACAAVPRPPAPPAAEVAVAGPEDPA